MEKFAEELKRKSGADGGKAWEIVESWYTRDGKARRLSLHDLHELSQAIAKELARIRAEARAEAMKDAVARARDYCDEILMWNDDAQDGIEAAILTDEPKDLKCFICGRKESAPYDVSDACFCGGQFIAGEPKEEINER